MQKSAANLIMWLVVLAMPFLLGFSSIRLFIVGAEFYVRYEYGKDNFPPDLNQVSEIQRQQLGLEPFTDEERRELALVAVDYLQRKEAADEVIYLLERQQLPGTDRPFYNEAEIGHMLDVKNVTDIIGRLNAIAALIVLGGLAVLFFGSETRALSYRAIFYGGVATTGVLLSIALFIALAWNVFFVQFHQLLFPPGTWTFLYSDSLIRLFPEKFWFDAGILLSGTALLSGVLVSLLGYVLVRRS